MTIVDVLGGLTEIRLALSGLLQKESLKPEDFDVIRLNGL